MTAAVFGRDEDLDSFRAFLPRARQGPSAFVFEGDPGIGKTMLWREALAVAEVEGFSSLVARPSEAEAQLPFAGLIDLLADVLDDVLPALPGPQASALAGALLRAEAAEAPAGQLAVSVGCLGVLRLLARQRPLVLGVDDLQWLDGSSGRVLAFCLRRLEVEPVCLLATRRVGGTRSVAAGFELGLTEHVLERSRVGALSRGALDLLLRDRLGLALPPPVLSAVVERSAGNPLHALELGRAVATGGSLGPGQVLQVPETLAGLVDDRIRGVSDRAYEVLLLASALSRPSVHVAAFGREQLGEALETGLLVRDGDRLAFSHPLYASVIYTGASPERRREAHRLLAQALDHPDERALHLGLASESADESVAAALEHAAQRVCARGAPDRAAALAEQAWRLTPDEQTDARVRRSFAAADYHAAGGDGTRARTILERLVATLPAGQAKANAYLRLGALATKYATIARLCRKALAHAGEDAALRARAHLVLGWAEGLSGGGVAVWEQGARRAAELAEESGATPVQVLALANLVAARGFRGYGVQRELVERALELDPEGEIVVLGESPRIVLGLHLALVDELDEGRALLEGMLTRATQRGWIPVQAMALYALSSLECRRGEFARAHRHAAESLELGRQLDLWNLEPMGLFASGLADACRGRVESARRSAEAGSARARSIGDMLVLADNEYALGLLALSLGDAAIAHEHLGPAVALMRSLGIVDPGVSPVLPNEIESAITLGEQPHAEALLRELEEQADRLGRARPLALAGRSRALVEAARGDLEAAQVSIERALAEHGRLPDPFERARTQLVEGAILRKLRKKRAAKATLDEALATFEQCGAERWAERARQEIHRLGLQRRPRGELTPGETRVAELVAAGRTNRQAAAELFLSEKTVEANLSRIYRKLGIHSRTELANELASRGKASRTTWAQSLAGELVDDG
jgi:DNA-binding CsgD family transcriptional regulator